MFPGALNDVAHCGGRTRNTREKGMVVHGPNPTLPYIDILDALSMGELQIDEKVQRLTEEKQSHR